MKTLSRRDLEAVQRNSLYERKAKKRLKPQSFGRGTEHLARTVHLVQAKNTELLIMKDLVYLRTTKLLL